MGVAPGHRGEGASWVLLSLLVACLWCQGSEGFDLSTCRVKDQDGKMTSWLGVPPTEWVGEFFKDHSMTYTFRISWCHVTTALCSERPGLVSSEPHSVSCTGDFFMEHVTGVSYEQGNPGPKATWVFNGGGNTLTAIINCDNNMPINQVKEIEREVAGDGGAYYAVFHSRMACPGIHDEVEKALANLPNPITPGEAELAELEEAGEEGAWIFIGLVLGIAATYFFGGYAYNYKKRELRGAEAIPHREFWRDFPSLVKDGVVFSGEKIGICIKTIRKK